MEPTLSVVVPVYNAMPYLQALLDSLVAQDFGAETFNVIAVDDGSTDGSAELLDHYARQHGNVAVIHQPNSGGPGAPRNAGLRAATARYVFFADADDVVAPQSLRRLVTFADAHGSDIVVPKVAPLGKRSFPRFVYKETRVDASLVTVFHSLFPQKLYRRRLLTENGIRFRQEGRLEDGIFNANAYACAKRISILADYDYYFLRARDDGRNSSQEPLQPAAYTAAVAEIAQIVRQRIGPAGTADRIISNLYRRKCLKIYRRRYFARMSGNLQDAWLAEHHAFIERFVSEEMERRLGSPFRERSLFVRRGDKNGLLAFSESAANVRMTHRGRAGSRMVAATMLRHALGRMAKALRLRR